MRRGRPLFALTLLATVALVLPVPIPAEAEPSDPVAPQEYVVVYSGATAAAESAITAAGGQVVEVNEDLKIAKVSSTDGRFVAEVDRAADVTAVVRNHAVGTSKPGLPHRFAAERPSGADKTAGAEAGNRSKKVKRSTEPLSTLQWDMDLIDVDEAHKKATGRGVDVGIIDTGIDASHPDLAKNFDRLRSRNFTQDIPVIDGPCEVATCIDPADTDDGGHGTHVAGTVAADDNKLGIGGVAPDATLVNLRAGQDSGYFFLYETVAALVEAGNLRLDVVNMSFYTDPWLYNCASRADYLSGTVTDAEIAEQATVRQLVLNAVTYAHDHGVTLVAAAGNGHTDLAAPTRVAASTPDYPVGANRGRTVTDNRLDLPNEAPEVISVSSVGPSTTKADYSNYGLGDVEVAAPGGWFRDGLGTPSYSTPGNLILSSYPVDVAIEEGLADENGVPTDDFSIRDCNTRGACGFYTYLQGTSMASPHAAGVAALIIDRYGSHDRRGGKSLAPDTVRRILEDSATDTACPAGGTEIYTDEGRPAAWNAVCQGTTDDNGLYGEGIINAARAVASRGH
jgi:subtilisin family serine protease